MKICGFTIILIWSSLDLISCITVKKEIETIHSFNKMPGKLIASGNLIQKYEREHQKLYNKETRDGTILKWPYLENKNLSNYCSKYLHHSVPKAQIDNVFGTETVRVLHYLKENTSLFSRIVVVQCKYKSRFRYVTRASKPNCVYALERRMDENLHYRFNIINEYCDFQGDPLENMFLKRKRIEMTRTVHKRTGQPVAKDVYLLQYELEHKNMLNKEGNVGKYMEWPCAMVLHNLDYYCFQYMKELAPYRKREGIKGILKTEKLHYQNFNTNTYVNVMTVTCVTTHISKLQYHMTRSPETNCVYALLRLGHNKRDPLVIVYKHCDFEESNNSLNISQCKDIVNKNIIPKIEVKEDISNTMKILELFPKD